MKRTISVRHSHSDPDENRRGRSRTRSRLLETRESSRQSSSVADKGMKKEGQNVQGDWEGTDDKELELC